MNLGFVTSQQLPDIFMPFENTYYDTGKYYWENTSINARPQPLLSTAIVKQGTRSLLFSGASEKIGYYTARNPLNFAGKDFTIDFWYYPLSLPEDALYEHDFFYLAPYPDTDPSRRLFVFTRAPSGHNDARRVWLQRGEGGTTLKSSRMETLTPNQWNHIAVMWKQDKGYAIAINGIISGSNGWYNLADSPPLIDTYYSFYFNPIQYTNSRPLHGYLDNFRITMGEALWGDVNAGSSFTPPQLENYTIYHPDRASDGSSPLGGVFRLTPSQTKPVAIELIGGGGGGATAPGGYGTGGFQGGPGAGGGAYGNHTLTLQAGSTYLLSVGNKGLGGGIYRTTLPQTGGESSIMQEGVPSTKIYAGGGLNPYEGGGGGTSNAQQAISGQPGQSPSNDGDSFSFYYGGAGGNSGSGAAGGLSGHITKTAGYNVDYIAGKRHGGGGAGGGGTNGGDGAQGLVVVYQLSTTSFSTCTEADWTSTLTPAMCDGTGQQTKSWTKIGTCTGAHPATEVITCGAPVSSCPANQTLFKLYQGGNSHIANASTVEATVPICYPAIFGTPYLGANPHACTGSNNLLWATSDKNAHAATVTSLTYGTPYCYGDVRCTVRNSFDLCAGVGERIVARLPAGPATSNLHVGNASFTSYPRVLCCALAGPVSTFGTIRWTTPTGTPITIAQVNQTVNVSVSTTLAPGTLVTFTIEEEDGLIGDDSIITLGGIVTNGKVTARLTLNDTLITLGKDGDTGATELEFTAKATQGISVSPTASLIVSLVQGGVPYLLEGNITGIYHGQVYLNGSALRINHTFSRNGNVQLNWTIQEDAFRTTNDSFMYNFTTPGQKTLTLHVSNNQGGHAELQIGVLVVPSVGGDGLMTFIDYPGYYQIIPTGRNPSTTFVAGANTSFAVVRNATACGALQCVGGKCPSVTNNTDLVCGNTLRNISAAPQPYGALRFTWDVYDDAGNWRVLREGLGIVTTVLLMRESAYSERRSSGPLNRLHDKQLRVTTNYTFGTTSLQSSFTRAFTLGQCLNRGETFAFVTNGQFVRFASTVSSRVSSDAPFEAAACKGEDGINGTLDDCVPTGWLCGATGGGYFPSVNATTPVFCDDFSTRAGCESASLYIPSQAICPGQSQSARCVWDTTRARCGTNYAISTLSGATTNMCLEFIDSKTECVEGLKDVTINSTLTRMGSVCQAFDDACQSRADTLVCGRPAYELPFFGWWQLVIGGIGIVVLGLLRRKVITLK